MKQKDIYEICIYYKWVFIRNTYLVNIYIMGN